MKILFVTFGDDTTHLLGLDKAAKRLESQAQSSGLFVEVLRFDYSSVISLPNFESIKPIFSKDKWGFGYFVWKPFVILWVLENYGHLADYVVYADAGCEFQINQEKQLRFNKILRELDRQPILAHFTELPEILSTKPSVLNALKSEEDKFRGNVEATVIYVKTGEAAMSFMNEWLMRCTSDGFSALMPVYDANNLAKLDLHRYDQSIFSVLYKNNYDVFLVPIRPRGATEDRLTLVQEFIHSCNVIWPIRNRSGRSKLNQTLNYGLISWISFPIFVLYRKARRLKHAIDPRARSDRALSLLIKYKELGAFAKR